MISMLYIYMHFTLIKVQTITASIDVSHKTEACNKKMDDISVL
jgi:hypothetical protein